MQKRYEASNVFIASFTYSGVDTKVVYQRSGNWHSMFRTYSEDKLPFDVRDLVKSKYYDYKIMKNS
jgi:hypothetical protein